MKQLFKLTTFFVAILTLGFMAQSCSTAKSLDKASLEGYWSLKTLKGETASDAFKGNIPSLEFNFDEQMISGSGGCNRYSGAYTLEGNTFSAPNLTSTLMACMEANKEGDFLVTLSTKELQLSLDNEILTFKDKSATILEFVKGQAPVAQLNPTDKQNVTAENIVGSWVLNTIKGEAASKLFGENPATLIVAKDGAVSGNAGCNNYRSKATVSNANITFTPMMSTKMACPRLEGEQAYSTILSTTVQGFIQGGTLTLTQKGEPVLEFVKSEE